MEKLHTSKAFLKMDGGRMHTSHPTPLDPPLVISYRNHQKSLACFSHLEPLILFFFTERPSQKGAGGGKGGYGTPLNTLLLIQSNSSVGSNIVSVRVYQTENSRFCFKFTWSYKAWIDYTTRHQVWFIVGADRIWHEL